jgi:hypothetical protein
MVHVPDAPLKQLLQWVMFSPFHYRDDGGE